MVKILNSVMENTLTKEIRAELFADTKSDNLDTVNGLLDRYKLSAGSSVITANGDFAFLNSTGKWVWI